MMEITMRESWTDERLDDFAKHVDWRFDKFERDVDRRFNKFEQDVDRRFNKVDVELHRINDRLDKLDLMAQGFIAMTSAILVGFGGMAGLIATQL
jgi:hypothetical protein